MHALWHSVLPPSIMVAMDCEPELAVTRRKTVSGTKIAKRLRRFVRENNQVDDHGADADNLNNNDQDTGDDSNPRGRSRPASGELLCRIPEETLFQLQQIYEALEESNRVSNSSSGGGGAGDSRRRSTSSTPSLRALISAPAAAGGGGEEDEGPSAPGNGDADGDVRTPEKSSKKRARDGDGEQPPPPATADKARARASREQESSPKKKKKKKNRRKSNPT